MPSLLLPEPGIDAGLVPGLVPELRDLAIAEMHHEDLIGGEGLATSPHGPALQDDPVLVIGK